jgi:hypothetical protein
VKIKYAIVSLLLVLALVAVPVFASTDQSGTVIQKDSTDSTAQAANANQVNSPNSENLVINSNGGTSVVVSSDGTTGSAQYIASQYVGTALPDSYYTNSGNSLWAESEAGPDPENPGPNVGNPYTPYSEAALFPGEIVAIPMGTNLKAGQRFNFTWWAGSPVAITVINDNDRSTAINSVLGQEKFDPVTQNITHPGLVTVPLAFDSSLNSGYSRINTAYVTIPKDGNYDWVVDTHTLQVAYQEVQYVPEPYGTIDFAYVGYEMS